MSNNNVRKDGIKKGLIIGLIGVILPKSKKKKDVDFWKEKDAKFWEEATICFGHMRIERSMDMEGWSESEKEGIRRTFEKRI